MQAITKELLKDPGARKDLQFALADMLGGIRDDWDLSTPELAQILSIPAKTVQGWLKACSHVGLSSVFDHNTQAVVDFIDIYNMVASFFVTKSDQIDWFKKPSDRFCGKSPMAMMTEHPHHLAIARGMVRMMLNP